MTDVEIKAAVVRALGRIAPEAEPASIRSDVPLREQVDIDSMDFLNFVIELDRELHVAVPEADYAKLRTLDDAAAYFANRLARAT
jgi:acyl carrier protein